MTRAEFEALAAALFAAPADGEWEAARRLAERAQESGARLEVALRAAGVARSLPPADWLAAPDALVVLALDGHMLVWRPKSRPSADAFFLE